VKKQVISGAKKKMSAADKRYNIIAGIIFALVGLSVYIRFIIC